MSRGLDGFVAVMRPGLPESLLSTARCAEVSALAARLPPGRGCILEFWLGRDGETPVDFQGYWEAGEGGALAEAAPLESPAWDAARRLFAAWGGDESVHAGLWLEFDLRDPALGSLTPRLGFARSGLDGYAGALESSFRLLSGRPLPREARATVERGLAALRGGTIYGTGFAPCPDYAPLRWCVKYPSLDEAFAFLERMEWRGDLAAARRLFPAADAGVALNVDLGDGLGPKIGVEYPARGTRGLLDELAARGLCRADEAEALRAPDVLHRQSRHRGPWPEALADMAALTGGESRLAQSLGHVKLVFQDGSLRAAKAYVYCVYAFRAVTGCTAG